MESNGSPDTIQRKISVLKGDVIATVPDPDLGMGGGGSPPIFFRPFGPQFSLKIRGGGGPPGPSPGSASVLSSFQSTQTPADFDKLCSRSSSQFDCPIIMHEFLKRVLY